MTHDEGDSSVHHEEQYTPQQVDPSTDEERTAFLEKRQAGMGASDIWPLLSGRALEVYHSKTRPLPEDQVNVDMMRGRLMEPVFRDMWARATGETVRRVGQRTHPTEPWAKANPDGMITTPTRLLEVKAPRSQVYRKLLEQGARAGTIMQVQWGLHVTGWNAGVYVAGNTESSPLMYSFQQERYDELIILMAAKVRVFWHEHVVPRVPPDNEEWNLLGQPILEQAEDWHSTGREILVAQDEEVQGWAKQYAEARKVKAEAEAMMKEVKPDLKAWLASQVANERVRLGPYELRLQQRKGRDTFHEDLLRQHGPLDRDAFVRWYAHLRGIGVDDGALEDVVAGLTLDLDQFTETGDPSEALTLREVGDE